MSTPYSIQKQIDAAFAEFLTKEHSGTDEENGMILSHTMTLVNLGWPICASLFSRAYAELRAAGQLSELTEKFVPEAAPVEQVLTAEIYHKMPSDELRKKMREPKFKESVFLLIQAGKI
jgi:hypothetical protein